MSINLQLELDTPTSGKSGRGTPDHELALVQSHRGPVVKHALDVGVDGEAGTLYRDEVTAKLVAVGREEGGGGHGVIWREGGRERDVSTQNWWGADLYFPYLS